MIKFPPITFHFLDTSIIVAATLAYNLKPQGERTKWNKKFQRRPFMTTQRSIVAEWEEKEENSFQHTAVFIAKTCNT